MVSQWHCLHDVKLYVKITNAVDLCVLQAAINARCQWADAWQLSISVEKSSVLYIGKTVPSTPMFINVPHYHMLVHVETLESLLHQI